MKNPDLAIRIGVIAKLDPLLTVPVRDMEARPDDEPPYVLLSTQTTSQEPVKSSFDHNCTLLIQVYSRAELTVNRGAVDAIAGIITEALVTDDSDDLIAVSGFNVTSCTLESMSDDTLPYGDGRLTTRKLIRLRYRLQEI